MDTSMGSTSDETPAKVDYEELQDSGSVPDILMIPMDATYQADTDFAAIFQEANKAVDAGILPTLNAAGSSGSYFVKNLEKVSHIW